MVLNGLFTDVEALGDLPVFETFAQELQYFHFPAGQLSEHLLSCHAQTADPRELVQHFADQGGV